MIPCHPLLYLNFNSEFKNVVCVKFKCKIEKKYSFSAQALVSFKKYIPPVFL